MYTHETFLASRIEIRSWTWKNVSEWPEKLNFFPPHPPHTCTHTFICILCFLFPSKFPIHEQMFFSTPWALPSMIHSLKNLNGFWSENHPVQAHIFLGIFKSWPEFWQHQPSSVLPIVSRETVRQGEWLSCLKRIAYQNPEPEKPQGPDMSLRPFKVQGVPVQGFPVPGVLWVLEKEYQEDSVIPRSCETICWHPRGVGRGKYNPVPSTHLFFLKRRQTSSSSTRYSRHSKKANFP